MNKISPVTQQIANAFPDWTRLRQESQSMGFQLLNAIADPLEKIETNLNKLNHNNFLSSVNLDEPALIFRVPVSNYEFEEVRENGRFVNYKPPTVLGHLDNSGSNTVPVKNIEEGTLKSFWEDSDPDRLTLEKSFSATPVEISQTALFEFIDGTVTYPLEHHTSGGGKFYFDLISTIPYIEVKDGDLVRARIRIEGINEKNVKDSEVVVFVWRNITQTKKNWKRITKIEGYDCSENATVSVSSEAINHSEYLSLSNLRYSPQGNKIDEFWGILNESSNSFLERVEYISDEPYKLIQQSAEKITKNRWALKNKSGGAISNVEDMALVPFKDKFWALSSADNKLYLFSLAIENYEKLDKLLEKDDDCELSINFVTEDVVTNEELRFSVWHERHFKQIEQLEIYYTAPDEQVTYLTNSGSSGFENFAEKERIIFQQKITIAQEGEYIFTAKMKDVDGEIKTTCKVFKNNIKTALNEFSLTGIVPSSKTPTGVYFDKDQTLVVKAIESGNASYYEVKQHKDVMLIDYEKKAIYLHEQYEGIGVT
jgi:hypothetical protein